LRVGVTHRQKKRKAEEVHHDEEHAEFDAKALKEHEEYTKVSGCLPFDVLLGSYRCLLCEQVPGMICETDLLCVFFWMLCPPPPPP
jgi:hypothetical protein